MNNLIAEEKYLKETFDCGTRHLLVRFLTDKGIPFDTTRKGRVWTTSQAINDFIAQVNSLEKDEWDFDER